MPTRFYKRLEIIRNLSRTIEIKMSGTELEIRGDR